jgi:thioredoxin-like negative regulator of GroEL
MNKLEGMKTHSDVAYVPSIMILKNGQKVKEYEGEKRKDKMLQFLLDNGLITPKRGGSCSKARQHKSRKGRKGRKSRKNRTSKTKRRKQAKSVRRKKSKK